MIETVFGGLTVIGIAGLFRAAYLHPHSYRKLNERVSMFSAICAAIAAAYFTGYRVDRDVPWSNPHVVYPLWIFAACAAVQIAGAAAPLIMSGLRKEEATEENDEG